MRNVTSLLRIWSVGDRKAHRFCTGHPDRKAVNGHNGKQQGNSEDKIRASDIEVLF
jgi:hypothetical protein